MSVICLFPSRRVHIVLGVSSASSQDANRGNNLLIWSLREGQTTRFNEATILVNNKRAQGNAPLLATGYPNPLRQHSFPLPCYLKRRF
ncbi:MAG: hypothetical protein EBU26_19155 [Verrucomicrobia bacterium]|nr:hypothetical protein [Verrucomicrobiota bacterium]